MRPRLKRQIRALSPEDAARRAVIGNKNISRFFTHFYAHLFGGRVRGDPWGTHFNNGYLSYSFYPDVVKLEGENLIYTEVKATSTETSLIQCPEKQIENQVFELLRGFNEGKGDPLHLEYAFFKYGGNINSRRGVNLLPGQGLVKALSKSKKSLVIIPPNLFIYLASFAYSSRRNQSSSLYDKDFANYLSIRGGTLTKLLSDSPLREIGEGHYVPKFLEEICLEGIEVEHSMSPPVPIHYYRDLVVEPFPIARYFIPQERYIKSMGKLVKNHTLVTQVLGIRDLFEESKEIPF